MYYLLQPIDLGVAILLPIGYPYQLLLKHLTFKPRSGAPEQRWEWGLPENSLGAKPSPLKYVGVSHSP